MSSGRTMRSKNEQGRSQARRVHQSNLVIALIRLMITLAPIEVVVEVAAIAGEGGIGKEAGVERGIGNGEAAGIRGTGGTPSVVDQVRVGDVPPVPPVPQAHQVHQLHQGIATIC